MELDKVVNENNFLPLSHGSTQKGKEIDPHFIWNSRQKGEKMSCLYIRHLKEFLVFAQYMAADGKIVGMVQQLRGISIMATAAEIAARRGR